MTDPGFSDGQPIALPTSSRRPAGPELRSAGAAFREIVRALAPDPHADPQTAPVVFGESTEPLMRRVIARYGFARLPATLAEFYALFEYCDMLDATSGAGMRPPDQLAEWQAAALEVWRRKKPAEVPAIERFCAGDADGLAALHAAEDTLARLGREYLLPED